LSERALSLAKAHISANLCDNFQRFVQDHSTRTAREAVSAQAAIPSSSGMAAADDRVMFAAAIFEQIGHASQIRDTYDANNMWNAVTMIHTWRFRLSIAIASIFDFPIAERFRASIPSVNVRMLNIT